MIELTTSREEIRKELLETYSKLLLIESDKLDQSDSAFNTYVVNALSHLSADLLFYASTVYRESSLVTAQLPESIINWASYLDYSFNRAVPARVGLLIQIPLTQSFYAEIPKDAEFTASDGTVFRNKYKVTVDFTSPDQQKVEVFTDDGVFTLPISFETTDKGAVVSFIITAEQKDYVIHTFNVPSLRPFEYFYKQIDIDTDEQVVDILVKVDGVIWPEKRLILLQPDEEGFESIIFQNKIQLLFGNGFFGKQPSGLIEVKITTTKGSKGNVISGTITSGEKLKSDKIIQYTVVNPTSATGGQDFETLYDIKRNSINSLKALHRIVSEEDFHNISAILGIQHPMNSKPILKRSDLTCNDVNVYITHTFNDKVIPTHSIPIELPSSTYEVQPFSSFTYESLDWICPFAIKADLTGKVAEFSYTKLYEILLITKTLENNETHSVSKLESKYDYVNDKIIFITYTVQNNISITYTQEFRIVYPDHVVVLSPTSVQNLNYNVVKREYEIDRLNANNITKIEILTYEDDGSGSVLRTTYETTSSPIFNFNNISYSHIRNISGTNYILDVPVILKSYWDSLSSVDREQVLQTVMNELIFQASSYRHRLMNTYINTKFTKTYGKTFNTKYSTPDYFVRKIVNSSTLLPPPNSVPGEFIALSNISDHTDPNYTYSGHLLRSTGAEYIPVLVGRGTIIINLENNTLYSSSGNQWIPPIYDLPLKVVVEIHFKYMDINTINEIKSVITNFINSAGIEGSLYLSKLVDTIHKYDIVRFCRVIKPETDIIYRDLLKNIPKQDFYFYTPEYIYTEEDLVEIIPITDITGNE